jgi:rhamnose utilization protein RhaD (predicted bifunctional aldolase and dehydrogenase)
MDAYREEAGRDADIIFLQNHGVFVGAESPQAMDSRYSYIMDTIRVKVAREPEPEADIKRMLKDRDSFAALDGAFTPDHIVYAGARPLFVENEAAIPEKPPKVVAIQGGGVRTFAPTEKAAVLAGELFRDAVKVSVYSENFGGPRFMDKEQVDFICNWEVERYRSSVSTK